MDAFEQWLSDQGLKPRTAKEYHSALSKNLSEWANEAGIADGSILGIRDRAHLESILPQLSALKIFKEKNASSHGRFTSALAKFLEFLGGEPEDPLVNDLGEIQADTRTNETEKRQLVNARLGQGEFRKSLLSIWVKCPVTGVREPTMLIASHIKPWAKSDNRERLNPFNGLLLTPHLDRAFDKGLISFWRDGAIMIADAFSESELLGIHPKMKIPLEGDHLQFLGFHRDHVFQGA